MPQIQTELKQKIKATGHSVADLARELGVSWDRVGSFLNGYRNIPIELEDQIWRTVEGWNGSKREDAGISG